jgi:AraC-like DNA-binding protein
MSEEGAFGDRLGSRFGMDEAPAFTVRALRRSLLAVTEINFDAPEFGRTLPIPPEDAFLVHVMTRDCLDHDLIVDGKSVRPDPFRAGVTAIYDLTRDPIADMRERAGCLSFYLPRIALEEIADDLGQRRPHTLEFKHGRAYEDPVMRALGEAIRPALASPQQISTLFVDHLALAFRAHIARAYAAPTATVRAKGGLAPWQQRKAIEILRQNLDGDMPLAQLASECGLSTSHFTRAFRQTLGLPPHKWLLKLRVEHAQERLAGSDLSLSDVALECGFADQSHFTRVFTHLVGASPGAWRRSVKG